MWSMNSLLVPQVLVGRAVGCALGCGQFLMVSVTVYFNAVFLISTYARFTSWMSSLTTELCHLEIITEPGLMHVEI